METKVLENAIIKLGSLLALGFGEAGSEIIGQNLDDDNACAVNAMVPGSKVEAIYGFAEIRNFATTTSVLQQSTMVFVNQVANIVHRIVDSHLGAANKNVGEAFLLVWRASNYHIDLQAKLADLSVWAFVQVVAELNRNRQLAQYREHPALLARLPRFRVNVGIGLNRGWSIEGAIGSEFKIDASYVSPHVNISQMLASVSSDYGVTILICEPLVRSCNAPFSRHFRPVDRVLFQGSKTPYRLFTIDLDPEVLAVENLMTEMRRKNVGRHIERRHRDEAKQAILEDSYQVAEIFDKDKVVRRMRQRWSLSFYQEFEKGYLNYEAGEWDVSEQVLRRTSTMLARGNSSCVEDGPSKALLEFMASSKYEAPSDWKGWRRLDRTS